MGIPNCYHEVDATRKWLREHGNVSIYEADGRSKAANVQLYGMGGLPGGMDETLRINQRVRVIYGMSMWRESLPSAVTEFQHIHSRISNHVGTCKREVCARRIR